jgi:protein-tyrosine phosphatase
MRKEALERTDSKIRVLFVCMGNICRSPSAEAVFHNMVLRNKLEERIEVASAGTHGSHAGSPADRRSHQAASRRGFDLDKHRARQLTHQDFDVYDYILIMDQANHEHVMAMCPVDHFEKVHYLMDFAPQLGVKEVPDPYYGGVDGFDHVLDLVEAACAGLLSDIRERHLDPHHLHPEINLG